DRRRERDVAHALAPDLVAGDLDPAALADDALEAHPLVLAARALPGLLGPEDLLAEQAVLLGAQGPVVDRLGLLDLARGPAADVLGRRQADGELVELVHVQGAHDNFLSAARRASSSSLPRSGRLMSMPSSRVTEKKSSSVSARSTWAPTLSRTSTFKQSDC